MSNVQILWTVEVDQLSGPWGTAAVRWIIGGLLLVQRTAVRRYRWGLLPEYCVRYTSTRTFILRSYSRVGESQSHSRVPALPRLPNRRNLKPAIAQGMRKERSIEEGCLQLVTFATRQRQPALRKREGTVPPYLVVQYCNSNSPFA